LAGSAVLLVLAVAMGVVCIWDIRGRASTMRARLEARSIMGAWYKRLPSWSFRVFGVWCLVCGVGQLLFVIATAGGH
jgi:hypothetical protein